MSLLWVKKTHTYLSSRQAIYLTCFFYLPSILNRPENIYKKFNCRENTTRASKLQNRGGNNPNVWKGFSDNFLLAITVSKLKLRTFLIQPIYGKSSKLFSFFSTIDIVDVCLCFLPYGLRIAVDFNFARKSFPPSLHKMPINTFFRTISYDELCQISHRKQYWCSDNLTVMKFQSKITYL